MEIRSFLGKSIQYSSNNFFVKTIKKVIFSLSSLGV